MEGGYGGSVGSGGVGFVEVGLGLGRWGPFVMVVSRVPEGVRVREYAGACVMRLQVRILRRPNALKGRTW